MSEANYSCTSVVSHSEDLSKTDLFKAKVQEITTLIYESRWSLRRHINQPAHPKHYRAMNKQVRAYC